MATPMTWVWERFRNSFRGLRIPEDELARVRTEEATTCSACKVTIESQPGAGAVGGLALASSCPFCGQPYAPSRSTPPFPSQTLLHEAVQASVGAGRVRSHRSSSEPLVPGFRLPPIERERSSSIRPTETSRVGELLKPRPRVLSPAGYRTQLLVAGKATDSSNEESTEIENKEKGKRVRGKRMKR
ncbi:hypothetical protein LSTR_LSTR001918 [Laodelphax striatellus]|uniref:Uncharacterized protein n=1 Tax=Laodelphax striatellus TaxID=195883 RepID=A0A482XGX1_LAOST|nr:hypothetical protein LSTR_LSTR001918 [Laodelphax striatellus]